MVHTSLESRSSFFPFATASLPPLSGLKTEDSMKKEVEHLLEKAVFGPLTFGVISDEWSGI